MAALTAKETAVGGTAGGALLLVWAARQAGLELPAEVALVIAGGLAWLAGRLTDKRGRHERDG